MAPRASRPAAKTPAKKAAKRVAKKAPAKKAAPPKKPPPKNLPAVRPDVRGIVNEALAPFRLDDDPDSIDGDLMRAVAGAVAVKCLTGILTGEFEIKDAGQAITVARHVPRLMVDLALFDAADELDKLSPAEARERAAEFADDLRRKRGERGA